MVIFRVVVGLQTQYFEGKSALEAARLAVASGLPRHLLMAGEFLSTLELDRGDSAAWALLKG